MENQYLCGDQGLDDTRHLVLELDAKDYHWVEGQSVGVIPPGLNEKGRSHHPRLYSIASPARNQRIVICVKRVTWLDDDQVLHKGVCSNYLCDLEVGDELTLTGPLGRHFHFDHIDSEEEIYIATGTGVAPFRARLHQLFDLQTGVARTDRSIWCIFGFQTSDRILYREEFNQFAKKFPQQIRFDHILSREQSNEDGSRRYVGDFVQEYDQTLMNILAKDNSLIYLCGIQGMEVKINAAFDQYCLNNDLQWSEFKTSLLEQARWIKEVY